MAVVTSSWATLRFRRSKDVKGWALLGIPQGLYPDVMQPLFERQTRFIEKHGRGEFVNVLFEAPVALAARLALAFPAPPSCEPLVVNQAGNRLLYGKFARSAKARPQAKESDAWPGLKLLNGDESFWQVVTTLSNVATLPLDRLHVPEENAAAQASENGRVGRNLAKGSTASAEQSPAVQKALHNLAKDGLKLQSAATLTSRSKLATPAASVANLDEEGFEEDDWEEEEAESFEEEVFEDVWDTDELEDFWDGPVVASALQPGWADSKANASSLAHRCDHAPVEKPIAPKSKVLSITPRKPLQLPARTAQSIPPAHQSRAASQPQSRQSNRPSGQNFRVATANDQPLASSAATPESSSQPVFPEESGTAKQQFAPQAASPRNLPQTVTPGNQALGRYRSGLVPHASDASSLQVYNSGGLTVADAIARSRQQEQEAQAIAEQAQSRRIKLPFERSPTVSPRGNPSPQETRHKPSWSYASPSPQLPEESWAEAAMAEHPAIPVVEPAWETRYVQVEASWTGPAWDSLEGSPLRHNPWLPPGQQQSQQLVLEAESRYYTASEIGGNVTEPSLEVADWGYYDEQGNWISCDPVMTAPLAAETSLALNGALAPTPTEIVCTPVEEEHCHILLQGVAVWNAWRLSNSHIRPNLRGAYLNNLDLAGADLHDVDLRFALLFRADLREVDLSLASLQGADLIRADLDGASLWGACLSGAYLSHANLAGADLTQADLQGVYWQGAILMGAVMPDGQLFEEQY